MHSAFVVAEQFCRLAAKENIKLILKKIGYMIYIAHGFKLATKDEPLVKNKFLACKNGPGIIEFVEDNKLKEFTFWGHFKSVKNSSLNKLKNDDVELIKKTFDKYKNYSTEDLENEFKDINTPWWNVYKNSFINNNYFIKNEDTKKYYIKLLKGKENE